MERVSTGIYYAVNITREMHKIMIFFFFFGKKKNLIFKKPFFFFFFFWVKREF